MAAASFWVAGIALGSSMGAVMLAEVVVEHKFVQERARCGRSQRVLLRRSRFPARFGTVTDPPRRRMARPVIPDIPGLPDRYDVRRYIAQTAYGDVVEAINHDRGHTKVALKLLRAEGSRAGVAREMFKREVEALHGLHHPAIVQILEAFECGANLLAIELELVPGGRSLVHLFEEVRIGRLPRPTLRWRLQMSTHLADAVIEAHRRSVIHRDIKPGNVLWNRMDDSLKLADFGIAAVLPLTVSDPTGMTLRSFYTRPFASPEQLLQKAPSTQSDVYGFGLLVASILALTEPAQEFEPESLDRLLAEAFGELRTERLTEFDLEDLRRTIAGALRHEPASRPTMSEFRDVLARLCGALVPIAQASVILTKKALDGINSADLTSTAAVTDDLNADLRVRLERDRRGERIKIFGRTLYLLLILQDGDSEGQTELLALDAGQNPGPIHESHRRGATACPIRLRLSPGPSRELVDFVREADRQATRKATAEIVERARLIIAIERERLPVFSVEATVLGGQAPRRHREEQISRASGYTGPQSEQVDVNDAFRLEVSTVTVVPSATMANVVRARLREQGAPVRADEEYFEEASELDWYAMFDDPSDIDVLDGYGHIVGKVTRFDRKGDIIHVLTDKRRTVPLVGQFVVKNRQKERQLRQQEMAIDALERGEAARADMSHLVAEAAAHQMGEKPWIQLLQPGLVPAARVRDLVNRILASETIFCLQGPPGTGKTTIIAEVVAQTLELDPTSRILVCAQANDAVANAIERVLALREKIGRNWILVRDVRPERAKLEGPWSGYEAAYREFVERVQVGVGTASSEAIQRTVSEWVKSVVSRPDDVARDYHGLVQVWGTTTARATRPLQDLDGESYDLVVIDEAAKATVGEVLVPVVHARRLLLVGDQKQLPPFLEDTTRAALEELGITEEQAKYSLFEHLFGLLPAGHRDMLDVQFRMHPSIANVVSRLFYDGRLSNGAGTGNRPLPPGRFDRTHRVLWLDVVGHDYRVGTSRANDRERDVIVQTLDQLDIDAGAAGMQLEVAVIAAYRGQADKLRVDLQGSEERWAALRVKAATVDAFQGREADVVLYSLVRVGEAERGFIADGRRFNVALSRARSLLIMIGDKTGARATPRLEELLELIPEDNQVDLSFLSGKAGRT